LLSRLEVDSAKRGNPTVAIANTPFDKFRGRVDGSTRLLVRSAATSPESVLKAAIAQASQSDELALRRISRVLRYCGYSPDVGIKVSLTRSHLRGRFNGEMLVDLSPEDASEIQAIWRVLSRGDFPKDIVWFDFDSSSTDYSYRSILPKLLRWEKLFKSARVISKVKLFLRNAEAEIPLRDASSGEISLISQIAFLAALPEIDDGTVLIDEPENSLHPRWQREYLDLVQEALKFRVKNIFVATHSPLIVSGITGADLSTLDAPGRVVVLSSSIEHRDIEAPASVEGVLADVFNVLTPANHYLSQSLVRLLNTVDSEPTQKNDAKREIQRYKNAATDPKQIDVLNAVEGMLDDISEASPNANSR
jgi:hypothetical protein